MDKPYNIRRHLDASQVNFSSVIEWKETDIYISALLRCTGPISRYQFLFRRILQSISEHHEQDANPYYLDRVREGQLLDTLNNRPNPKVL